MTNTIENKKSLDSGKAIEFTKFKLNEGVTIQEYLEKFEPVLDNFLKKQDGFLGIEHLQDEDGWIANYVSWDTIENAKKAAEKAMQNEWVGAWFALMSQDGVTMEHYSVIN